MLLSIVVSTLFCTLPIKAQPGWQDFTQRYSYTILDKNGKAISFKGNEDYSIMVDSELYSSPNVPQDSLKPATQNSFAFENQIRINDFSLVIPINSNYETQKQLEIKIIHKKDTMYIYQSSGAGSFWIKDFQGKPTEPSPDFTFRFIGGHYFFPSWTKNLLDNIPQTSGNVKIKNIDQRHFIIPKTVYDSVFYFSRKYDMGQKYKEEAENLVVKNFMNGYYYFERSIQPTTFDRSVQPFNKPRWSSWGNSYFSTKDKNEYLGIVDFSYDTLNWSGGRGMIVRFDRKKNQMKIWSPTEKLMYSSTALLYKDTFNDVYYNRSIIRDSNCKELIYKCDFINKFYRSTDEGKMWEEDKKLTQLYQNQEFRKLEFLDKNHALIFKLDKIRPENKKYDIQQGTYYLLKDFRIIDSLKTPKDLHYNDNYNRYQYSIKNDTILLGSWTDDPHYTIGKTKYFQPILKKVGNQWKFQVIEKTYSRIQPKTDLSVINFRNFKILNNLLFLNNENGSLDFSTDLSELHKKGLIFERGNQIYLIGLGIGTLLSFDGGSTWYVYPLPLEKDSRFDLLEINEQGGITHLKNSWGKNGYEFNKVFSQFLE